MVTKVRYTPVNGAGFAGYRAGSKYLHLKVGFLTYRLGVKELGLLALIRMLAGNEGEVNKREPLILSLESDVRAYNERIRRLSQKGLIVQRKEGRETYIKLSRLGILLLQSISQDYYDVDLEKVRQKQEGEGQ
jgi:predicted transcriptional regulator